jgi:hypothetical protein
MTTASKFGLFLLCGSLMTACGSGGSGTAADMADLGEPLYLDKATSADVDEHTVVCDGGAGARACIVICHVPPGNPDARHTIRISPSALDAHLNHGSNAAHANQMRDYLGECRDGNSGGGDDGGGGTPTPTPTATPAPTATPEPTATPAPSPSPTPAPACSAYPITERDQNCDGLDDATGDPLY